jgi:hypothetical protein
MTRPWERALLARMQGMAVTLFFIWLSATLRMRGSRESSTTWHGYATACQESIQPKAMWAPALVPPPLIGRHRSRCSWDVPVTPFKRCLVQRMQRICERRSTLLKGTGGKLPCLAPSTQLPHKLHLHSDERRSHDYCTGGGIRVGGCSSTSMVE